jgi:Lar family restriction alleviation protein
MQLEPCPFCGGEAERLELTDEDNFGGSVICCKQCGASSSVHFDRKENLEDGWNRRVQAVQPVPVVMGREFTPDEQKTFEEAWRSSSPLIPIVNDDTHQFKNFHRLLCERFGYCHDEKDWRRDQVSLIEHIAALTATASTKPVAYTSQAQLDRLAEG